MLVSPLYKRVSDRHPRHGRGSPYASGSRSLVPDPRTVFRLFAVLLVVFVLSSTVGQIAPISYVNSGSMTPTLETGDGFLAVPSAVADAPERGDVIVYRSTAIEAGGLVTHRIVDRTDEGFVTQGDANPITDQQAGEPPVSRDRIVAQVVTVEGHVLVLPNVGTLSMWVRGHVRASGLGMPAASLELLVLAGSAVLFWRGW